MRGFSIWLLSAAVAFFLTAGAFLLLANLGSNVSERNRVPGSPSGSQPLVELILEEDRLSSLRPVQDQRLQFRVKNGSGRSFSQVSVTVRVSSDNTAFGESRYYRVKIDDLKSGQSKPVESRVDLSPFEDPGERPDRSAAGDEERIILEVQATTPEGLSSVKTAILPF